MGKWNDRGFTLIELLIVVAILALLAVSAVPKVITAVASSRQAKIDHDLHAIQGALERHYTDLNFYPQKLDDLIARGYLKNGFKFKVPGSTYYYFYGIDDNWPGHRPQAYILGAPGKQATDYQELHRGGPLPKGWRSDQAAYAWKDWYYGRQLELYKDDDTTPLPDPSIPASLATYRTSCRTAGATCDTITN